MSLDIVESIPSNLTYSSHIQNNSTYTTWMRLISIAEESIDIASYYWNLRDTTHYVTSWQVCVFIIFVFKYELFEGTKYLQCISVSRSWSSYRYSNCSKYSRSTIHTRWFRIFTSERYTTQMYWFDRCFIGYASVRSLNFSHFLGNGILHTKFLIIDSKHVYIGSANMDWKSLTEVWHNNIIIWKYNNNIGERARRCNNGLQLHCERSQQDI